MALRNFKGKIGWVFFCGLIIRSGFLLFIQSQNPQAIFYEDSASFFYPILNLFSHGVYGSGEPLVPDPFRTPIYPLLCAIISLGGEFPAAICWFQVLIIYSLTFWFLAELIGKNKYSLGLLAFFSFNVPHIVYGTMIMPDTLFVLELALILWLLARQGLGALTGFWLGILHLTRPLAWPILGSLVIFYLIVNLNRNKALKWYPVPFKNEYRVPFWRPLAIFFVAFFLTLSPWLGRNFLTFGKPFVSLLGPHATIQTLAPALLAPGDPEAQEALKRKFLAESGDIKKDPVGTVQREFTKSLEIFKNHPQELFVLALKSSFVFLFNPERSSWVEMLKLKPFPGRLQFNDTPWREKLSWLIDSPIQLFVCGFQLLWLLWIWLMIFRCLSFQKILPGLLLISFICVCWLSGPSLTARKRLPLLVILPLLAAPVKLKYKDS